MGTATTYFEGPVAKAEVPRLLQQHEVIRELMLDGKWRSLAEIRGVTGHPEASISAQLRHLRKERFGAYRVEKRRIDGATGLWVYRVSRGGELG